MKDWGGVRGGAKKINEKVQEYNNKWSWVLTMLVLLSVIQLFPFVKLFSVLCGPEATQLTCVLAEVLRKQVASKCGVILIYHCVPKVTIWFINLFAHLSD